MSSEAVKDHTEFILPPSVVRKVDLARLLREFEAVDNALTTKDVRQKAGASANDMPAMSPRLSDFLQANPVDLENDEARREYIRQLKLLKKAVKVMNMTFAVAADPESLQQLAAWVRESVHPQTVIEAHLQPALVAGVYIRSENHVFDFSVRNAIKGKREELKKELEALRG